MCASWHGHVGCVAVQIDVSEVAESSFDALRQLASAWQAVLVAQRSSAGAALTSLEDAAGTLQAQLHKEVETIDSLRTDLEIAQKVGS